jgi:hypothetical protein
VNGSPPDVPDDRAGSFQETRFLSSELPDDEDVLDPEDIDSGRLRDFSDDLV